MRVLECGQWQQRQPRLDFKRVNGGLLVRSRSWNGWFNRFESGQQRVNQQKKSYRISYSVESGEICEIERDCLCEKITKQSVLSRPMSRVYSAKNCRY